MQVQNYICDPDSEDDDIATTSELLRCAAGKMSPAESRELRERILISPFLTARLKELQRVPAVAAAILRPAMDEAPAAETFFSRLRSLTGTLAEGLRQDLADLAAWAAPVPVPFASGFFTRHQSTPFGNFSLGLLKLDDGGAMLRFQSPVQALDGLTLPVRIVSRSSGEILWTGEMTLRWTPSQSMILGAVEVPARESIRMTKSGFDPVFQIPND